MSGPDWTDARLCSELHLDEQPVPRKNIFRLVYGNQRAALTKDALPTCSLPNSQQQVVLSNVRHESKCRIADDWSSNNGHFVANDTDPFGQSTFDDDQSVFDEFFVDASTSKCSMTGLAPVAASTSSIHMACAPTVSNGSSSQFVGDRTAQILNGKPILASALSQPFNQSSSTSVAVVRPDVNALKPYLTNLNQQPQPNRLQPLPLQPPAQYQKAPTNAGKKLSRTPVVKPVDAFVASLPTHLSATTFKATETFTNVVTQNTFQQPVNQVYKNGTTRPQQTLNNCNSQPVQFKSNKITIQLSIEEQKSIKWLTEQLTKVMSDRTIPLSHEEKVTVDMLEKQRRLILERAMLQQQQQLHQNNNAYMRPVANVQANNFLLQTHANGTIYTQNVPVAAVPSFMPGQIVQINGMTYLAVPTNNGSTNPVQSSQFPTVQFNNLPTAVAQLYCKPPAAPVIGSVSNSILPQASDQQHISVIQQKRTAAAYNVVSTCSSLCAVPGTSSTGTHVNVKRKAEDTASILNARIKEQCVKDIDQLTNPCRSKPFANMNDIFSRLLPFHVVDEPNIKDEFWRAFDKKYVQTASALDRRKRTVFAKLQCLLLKEASKPCPKADGLVADKLWVDSEREILNKQKEQLERFNTGQDIYPLKPGPVSNKAPATTADVPASTVITSANLDNSPKTHTRPVSFDLSLSIDECIDRVRKRVMAELPQNQYHSEDMSKATLAPSTFSNLHTHANLFDSFDEIIAKADYGDVAEESEQDDPMSNMLDVSVVLDRITVPCEESESDDNDENHSSHDIEETEVVFDYRERFKHCNQCEADQQLPPKQISPQSSTISPAIGSVVEDSLRNYLTSYTLDSVTESNSVATEPVLVVKEMSPELHPVTLVDVKPPKLILRINGLNIKEKRGRHRSKKCKQERWIRCKDDDASDVSTSTLLRRVHLNSNAATCSSEEECKVDLESFIGAKTLCYADDDDVANSPSLFYVEAAKKVPPLKIRLNKRGIVTEPLTKLSSIGLESSDEDSDSVKQLCKVTNDQRCKVDNCPSAAIV